MRRELAAVTGDAATALRLVSAMAAEDSPGWQRVMDEVADSGRPMYVLASLATLMVKLAKAMTARLGGDPQEWLDGAALAQLDEAAEARRRLGEDGENA